MSGSHQIGKISNVNRTLSITYLVPFRRRVILKVKSGCDDARVTLCVSR